eukprot:GFUD01009796.1.p1 GENE.GFUD01009796.1~~GFUD01009796.1.p1  ORF type:complete len:275 (+),score=70.23 GFUD01009796.1:57-881(+)
MRVLIISVLISIVVKNCSSLQGSCRASKKCCDGKDTDCAVQKADINSIIMDLSDEPCYCDHGCLDMGDCCPDFKEYCGVLDCEVSAWSSWSPCSSSCGAGTSSRHRTVTRPESNGGVSCPDLHQAKACSEGSCSRQQGGHSRHDSAALRESAMILPGKYSQLGEDKYDVRQNLKTFREEENDDQYCVVFRVDKGTKACATSKDTKKLRRGSEVCVSCESKATRPHLGDRCSGHGVEDKTTRFKNVITPGCHGRWTKTAVYDKCPCPGGQDFIFV